MERLKLLREKKGVLQKDVAKFLGVDRTTYVKYERGGTEPNNEMLLKLADYFNVSVDYLLGKEKNSPENSEEFEESVAFNRNGKKVVYKISKDKIDLLETLVKNLKDQDDPDL